MSCDSFIASANCVELLVDLVELVRRPARPRTARRHIRARSPPSACSAASPSGERREVDLGERLLDQPLVVGVVERLAGDLLGREHGQVGDLLADLLERALRLGLDVAARRGDQLLALGLAVGGRLRDRVLGRLARPGDDVVRLLARLLEPLAVLGSAAGRPPRAVCSDASMFSRIALARFSSASPIRGKANFESTNIGDPEGEQRPEHQPERGRDEEAASLLLRRRDRQDRRECGQQLHQRPRGRTRSGRR